MNSEWTNATWRKSTKSNGSGDCTEVASLPGGLIGVRDSKLGESSPILAFTQSEWQAFLAGAKAGEFDDLAV
jgi:hypothetical protein